MIELATRYGLTRSLDFVEGRYNFVGRRRKTYKKIPVTFSAFQTIICERQTLITPPEGSGFAQTAVANENQLVFWIDGVQYEWLSKGKIVPADGSFQAWMKFDPTFSFPPQKTPPEVLDGTRWSHGAFDKLPGEKKEE
jgi:hypothetical protein